MLSKGLTRYRKEINREKVSTSKSLKFQLTKEQKEFIARYDTLEETWKEQFRTEPPVTREQWIHSAISSEYNRGWIDGLLCAQKIKDQCFEEYYQKYPESRPK